MLRRPFDKHLCSAPLQDSLRFGRLGYEHDTLWLLPLRQFGQPAKI